MMRKTKEKGKTFLVFMLIFSMLLSVNIVPISAFAAVDTPAENKLSIKVLNEDEEILKENISIKLTVEGDTESEVVNTTTDDNLYEFPLTEEKVKNLLEGGAVLPIKIEAEITNTDAIYKDTLLKDIMIETLEDVSKTYEYELGYKPYIEGEVNYQFVDNNTQQVIPQIKVYGETLTGLVSVDVVEGKFSFKKVATAAEITRMYIEDTDEYEGVIFTAEELNNNENKVTIQERFTAESETDFSYGENTLLHEGIFSVKEDGQYEVIGNGTTLCKTLAGTFEDKITIKVENGVHEKFYVKNGEGKISKPVTDNLKVDSQAPIVERVKYKSNIFNTLTFGLFANKEADLTLNVTASDNLSGISSLSVLAKLDDGTEEVFSPETHKETGNEYKAEIVIPKKELGYKATLYVIAKDGHGNESTAQLIGSDKNISTVYIEDELPTITGFDLETEYNEEQEWAKSFTGVNLTFGDALSGINKAEVKVNNMLVKEFVYSTQTLTDTQNIPLVDFLKDNASEDGTYQVSVTIIDNAGNKFTDTKSVKYDNEAPTLSIEGITNNSIVNNMPTVTFKVGDNYLTETTLSYEVFLNGNRITGKSEQGKATVSYRDFNSDGIYKIKAVSFDKAGNKSQEQIISFTKDTEGADINLGMDGEKSSSDSEWYNGRVTFNVGAVDEITGIKNINVMLNNKLLLDKNYNGELTVNNLKAVAEKNFFVENASDKGIYKVTVKVTDIAGNVSSMDETFKCDAVNPAFTLSGITKDAHYNKAPTLEISLTEKYIEKAEIILKVERDNKVVEEKTFVGKNEIAYNDFKKDGVYKISVNAKDEAGNEAAMQNITFVCDYTKPVLALSGVEENKYYANKQSVKLNVNELNFKDTVVKVTVEKTLDGKTSNVDFGKVVLTKENDEFIKEFTETGTYKVVAESTDKAGNVASSKALTFTIDTVKPTIKIEGVKVSGNGYDAVVAPVIKYNDSYFAKKKVTLTSSSRGLVTSLPAIANEGETGGTLTYANFIKQKSYDDFYTLKVEVEDKAGNISTEQIQFSVNRFGSIFEYTQGLNNLNNNYVKNVYEDIKVLEHNVSDVTESEVIIIKDGERIEAKYNKEGGGTPWRFYTYTLSKDNFKEEGVYSINLITKDTVGNVNESGKENPVTFSVDQTAPMISVENVEDNMISETKINAGLHIFDNMGVAKYEVYSNDIKLTEGTIEEVSLEETVSFEVPEGTSQDIKIIVTDKAGNESIKVIKNITVSESLITRFMANKTLLYTTIFGSIAAIGIVVFLVIKNGSIFMIKTKKK